MLSYPPISLRRSVLAALAVALTPFSALGQESSPFSDSVDVVEVFTTAGTPMTRVPPGAAVIELDAPARLDAELSRDLPADPAQASAVMRERMQSPEWDDAIQRYGELHTGLARAWVLGVERVPAVVVDGEYVVYGETDVTAAVNQILAARGEVSP